MRYSVKHNDANAEDNRYGSDANFSHNCGAEGATDDVAIDALRSRQIRNFLLTLLVSRGVPMLLGGDEFRRTQQGNNNAYCQDNETSWFNWSNLERHQDIYRFARGMIAFRRAHPVLSAEEFYGDASIHWLDPYGGSPDWSDAEGETPGCLIHEGSRQDLLLLFKHG